MCLVCAGATLDLDLLTYFAGQSTPFMMECCERTAADKKGGHLARRVSDGQLILRESAQCAEEDEAAFQSVDKHRYFNTNNLWIRLDLLEEAMEAQGGWIALPTILNSKTVDPQKESSPPVYQLETAMGAAIECFAGSCAVCVPRSRFAPVKKCSDLLLLRSDAYVINADNVLVLNSLCGGRTPMVDLDSTHYKMVEQLDALVGAGGSGYPSLVMCKQLKVKGKVQLSGGLICRGVVEISNPTAHVQSLPAGLYADRTVDLSGHVVPSSCGDNSAFVFIKPHANTAATQALVASMLTARGVRIIKEGELSAEQIDTGMLIDQHYYAIASKATLLQPAELPVPVDKFEGERFAVMLIAITVTVFCIVWMIRGLD